MARVKSKKYAGVYLNHLEGGDISYSITYNDTNTKKIWFTVGKKSNGITEPFAYNKRAEFINQSKLGVDPIAHKKKKQSLTLDTLADTYFTDKEGHNKSNTKQRQKYNLHIKPLFGNKIPTKEDISKLQNKLMSEGKAPKTTNGIMQLLTAIINHSIKEKGIEVVSHTVKRLKTNDNRERYLTRDEVHTLIEAVKHDSIAYHFTRLALSTGARLEGVLNIKKKDIGKNTITLSDLKSGSTYTGFYGGEYAEELQEYIKALSPNDFVVGASSVKIPQRTIQNRLQPILNKLFNEGLEIRDSKNRAVIHTLRHTFASHLAINGTPIFTIQKLMNHTDIKMTLRYAKLAPDSGLEMVRGLYL